MKKIIVLAIVALTTAACDPFNDEPGGTPAINSVVVSGRNYGPIAGTEAGGTWTVTGVTPATTGTSGRLVIVTTNQLLDGASIEATPGTCDQAGNWLTVTGPAMTGQAWRTCYYPSSASARDGASVFIYYGPSPGLTTALTPIRTGDMVAGTYTFRGSIKTKGGGTLPIAVDVTVAPPAP